MSVAVWPARVRVLRGPGGSSMLVDARALTLGGVLAASILALAVLALTLGESEFGAGEVLAALFGQGDSSTVRVVQGWRLPRVALAVIGGASLAVSGAIFQSMTRNPLGSPDIIGFSTGAYTGALVVTLVLGAGTASVPLGAFAGGLATALAVYALAFKRGVQGFRLIVVGIAVSAVLGAINAYLLVTATLEEAVTSAIWGAGTLNEARWPDVLPVLVTLVVLAPICVLLARRLSVLELGDDHARMLGLRVEPTRIALIVVGVGLVSVVTAITGPITFVALAAPQIAKRIVNGTGPALMASALVGALLLLASDLLAQRVIAPGQYPVGVITACVGGAYLVWLLSRGMKEQS